MMFNVQVCETLGRESSDVVSHTSRAKKPPNYDWHSSNCFSGLLRKVTPLGSWLCLALCFTSVSIESTLSQQSHTEKQAIKERTG